MQIAVDVVLWHLSGNDEGNLTLRELEESRQGYAESEKRPLTAFILVSGARYREIAAKFQSQQRFQQGQLGDIFGMWWSGALVIPSRLVSDCQIGFMPVPESLGVIRS